MNKTHFDQIIANYVEKFADLNSPATGQDETYKWRIAKQFKPKMDAALTASDISRTSAQHAENLSSRCRNLTRFARNAAG